MARTKAEIQRRLKEVQQLLRQTARFLQESQRELEQAKARIAELLPPDPPFADRPLLTNFEEAPEGRLIVRFSRSVSWMRMDPSSAQAFSLNIQRWLSRQAQTPKKRHLTLVKEPKNDG